MSKTKTTRYDVAEHLRTPEEMAAYLEACLEEANGDAAFIAKALGDIARAKGMAQVARDAGLSRESLYKALSGERSPGFDTILKVMAALGLKLHAFKARTGYGVLCNTSLNFKGKGFINKIDDLSSYAVKHNLDGFVIEGRSYILKSSRRYQTYLRMPQPIAGVNVTSPRAMREV